MKRFLIKLSYTVLPIWIVWIGLMCYYNLTVLPNQHGDLGEVGRIPFKRFYEPPVCHDFPEVFSEDVKAPEKLRKKQADILTCGDSFSQLGVQGYQNYLCGRGKTVLNFAPPQVFLTNPLQNAFDLMRLNYIDSSNVKMLIVETSEKWLNRRISDFDSSHPQMTLLKEIDSHRTTERKAWTLKGANDFLLVRLGISIKHVVKKVELNRKVFSGTQGNRLYFYDEDLMDFSIGEKHEQLLRNYVDKMRQMAIRKGIKVCFLICPDKYDVYQDYIIDNPYPKKTINEDVKRILGNRTDIVIAKEILMPKVKAGEKDIYYMDDTHWSFKAARYVADYLFSIIP